MKPLPPDVFNNVLGWAAEAINRLEDGDRGTQQERSRLHDVARDQRERAASVATLRSLIDRYCTPFESDVLHGGLAAVEHTVSLALDGESETWLRPKEGRPRREEHDHFAVVILSLNTADSSEWPIQRAARAVAAVVDSVWKTDPRTKTVAFAKRLWGDAHSSN